MVSTCCSFDDSITFSVAGAGGIGNFSRAGKNEQGISPMASPTQAASMRPSSKEHFFKQILRNFLRIEFDFAGKNYPKIILRQNTSQNHLSCNLSRSSNVLFGERRIPWIAPQIRSFFCPIFCEGRRNGKTTKKKSTISTVHGAKQGRYTERRRKLCGSLDAATYECREYMKHRQRQR